MPQSPEQEWTLVACGLVAHADGILDVGEWDQVLWMLDERLAADEAAGWLELLRQRQALQARLAELPLPPPLFTESILERAWRMALADGRGSDEERAVHDEIASRLGADPAEVKQLRQRWREQAARRADAVIAFAAMLANADGVADSGERAEFDDLVARMPVDAARREQLAQMIDAAPSIDDVVGRLAALAPEERGIALVSLVPIVRASFTGDRERHLFLELAERVAIPRADAERMLER
ncbi:MAG: TerB family tellurite resistance protein [Deltaproteobacteria bacterium]|nr:TerB family tellurite resistance protein [Deltaproteobacteria bacterium]